MIKEYKRQKVAGLETPLVLFDAVDDSWHISISPSQIKLEGNFTIEEHSELEFFAKLVSKAWTEHTKLIPKIVTAESNVTLTNLQANPKLPEWMRLK